MTVPGAAVRPARTPVTEHCQWWGHRSNHSHLGRTLGQDKAQDSTRRSPVGGWKTGRRRPHCGPVVASQRWPRSVLAWWSFCRGLQLSLCEPCTRATPPGCRVRTRHSPVKTCLSPTSLLSWGPGCPQTQKALKPWPKGHKQAPPACVEAMPTLQGPVSRHAEVACQQRGGLRATTLQCELQPTEHRAVRPG